jgi:hypothetical protein
MSTAKHTPPIYVHSFGNGRAVLIDWYGVRCSKEMPVAIARFAAIAASRAAVAKGKS